VHTLRICEVLGISDVHDALRISEVCDVYFMKQ